MAGPAASSAYRRCTGSRIATTASVTAFFSAPYVVEAVGRPAARHEDLDQVGDAGLVRERRTASAPVSESVTARATLRRTTSGGSRSQTDPGSPADFYIFEVGRSRSITRAPTAGVTISGTVKTGPYAG